MNYNLEDINIPDNTIVIKLTPKEDVTEQDGLYLISNTIQVDIGQGQVMHVADPNVFIPHGIIIKTGAFSKFKIGDEVFVADEVPTIKINVHEANPYPFVMPYGFWLNPHLKYKVQTDMVHIPETFITAWVTH
jgi:hypothetical protein